MTSAEMKQLARERWSRLQEWFASREPREQWVLKVLAAVAVLVVLYWIILAPSLAARDQARRQYVSHMQTLEWINANSGAVQAARSASNRSSSLSANWVSEVSRSADDFGLTLRNFTPDGNRSVRIQLEDQSAAQAVLWLQSLQQKGVQLGNLEMTPGDKSGTATVRATLQQ
ncbi:MAG: type II secretion system protein GspM [Pseudomonadota bacterium]|nr:type II secretion system protein GspM [Pseudomonadota bacterium]